jgi:hypothetical protein
MRHKTAVAAMVFLFGSLVLGGCSRTQSLQLDLTRDAMEAARSAEAPEYAPYDWARAQADWEMAMALIHMDRYGEAKNVLVTTTADYNRAQRVAEERVVRLKASVDDLKQSVDAQYVLVKQEIAKPGLPASVKKDLESSLPQLDLLKNQMDEFLQEKRYLHAREAANAMLTEIYDLFKEIRRSRH